MLRNFGLFLLCGLLASCTAMEPGAGQGSAEGGAAPAPAEQGSSAEVETGDAQQKVVDAEAELSVSAADLAQAAVASERVEPIIYKGSDQQVRVPPPPEPVKFIGEDVSLNFEQAPLGQVMHAIMGDILKLDYVVDGPIEGKVTLRTRTPIPRDQLLAVLESLLMANSAILIRGSDGRYLVSGSKQGTTLSPQVAAPGRDGAAGYSTVIVPLRYISAANMAEILQPVATEDAFVRVDSRRNILMLAGTRQQIDGWLDIVTTFDVDQLAGMSVGLFPLENASVNEVAEALSSMLDGEEDGQLVRVIPVRRLNSVLLVTPRSHYLDTLGVWIERLDSLPDSRFERRLHVYPVQNTSASRLAELLNSIYMNGAISGSRDQQSTRSTGSTRRSSLGGVAPGMSPETLGSGSSGSGSGSSLSNGSNSLGGNSRSTAAGPGQSRQERTSISRMDSQSADFEERNPLENVRVVADDDNNALMIYATGKQYEIILAALTKLDVVATQVIIEASIIEVSLTDELQYGLEWAFNNDLGDYDGRGTLSDGSDTALSEVVTQGFNYFVTKGSGDLRAVLRVLSKDNLINVISTPSVMVLDNHTAFIHVGDQQPIIDQQTTSDASDTGRITQSITYRDTGVQLEVTPSVNAGGLITMDVAQSISNVGEIDLATGQRSFTERTINSRVAVRSNESVVLGGLISERGENSETGIPVLHKLPVVGPLFGTTGKQSRRTELLVIITPRAIYNESELRDVSDEMRSRIRHMELIEVPQG